MVFCLDCGDFPRIIVIDLSIFSFIYFFVKNLIEIVYETKSMIYYETVMCVLSSWVDNAFHPFYAKITQKYGVILGY